MKLTLTKEEKEILINLITNEQTKHLIPKDKYDSEEYFILEQLKTKIKIM